MQKRVLIVDADMQIRDSLARNLASWGYEITLAADGTEAWAILQKKDAPKIVVVDGSLEGLSCFELCGRIREMRGDDSYIVVLAGNDARASQIDALEAGADVITSKPIHMRELRVKLAAGLRGRRLAASEAPSMGGPLSTKDPADRALVGRVVAEKYQIVRLIGKGGMGTVWEGTHLALGTRVAIKFIKPEYARHELARARFELEARSAARLQTKYAVKVFDYGVTEGGLPYIVMEYLEGPSLIQRVHDTGPLSFHDTVTLVAQTAHALGQLHASGTIHRDVKPDNIIFVIDPDVAHTKKPYIAKVIDFGVAKVLAAHRDQVPDSQGGIALCTQNGIVIGTPNYMPPEQLRGEDTPNLGSDLWALAACAFTAMTGRIPFEGATLPEVVKKVCKEALPVPSRVNSSVPPEFDAWFARACSRDPEKRFRSARDMARALADAYASWAEVSIDMTPSLNTFVGSRPPPPFPARVARASGLHAFDLDAPTLAFS